MGHHPVRGPARRLRPVAAPVGGRDRELPVVTEQFRRTRRVGEQPVDAAQRVVPGGARHRPLRGEVLVAGEDLLHHRPPPPGGLVEPFQIGGRGGEAVRVVDAQPVEDAVAEQFEDLGVGVLEDLRMLHAHPDQLRDGEEPPVVQLGAGQAPPAEPVVLGVQQLRQREARRAVPQRERVVVVAQHLPVHREVLQLPAERPSEHRQQHLPAARRPVDVEPAGVRGVRPLAQHLPQPAVVPGEAAMWLGTMSATSPRPCSRAAEASERSPSSPPSSSRTRPWSTTS